MRQIFFFLVAFAYLNGFTQQLNRVQLFDGSSYDFGRIVKIDQQHNVYMAGEFYTNIDIDPGPGSVILNSSGSRDIFIVKTDSAGNFIWGKRLGGTDNETLNEIAVDDSLNVYIVGSFEGTVDFDPGVGIYNLSSLTSEDGFICKLNAAGNFKWAGAISGIYDAEIKDIAVGIDGSAYTIGTFQGTTDFDPGLGTFNISAPPSDPDVFVLKLDVMGSLVWVKRFGNSADTQRGEKIALDENNCPIISGIFYGTVDFDPGPGIANLVCSDPGATDIFICKLDSAGDFGFAKQLGSTSYENIADLLIDSQGNIYETGSFYGTVDFDLGPGSYMLSSLAYKDIFILKMDEMGNFIMAISLQGNSYDDSYSMVVDSSSYIYLTGMYTDMIDLDPGPGLVQLNTLGANNESFVAKYSPSGSYIWHHLYSTLYGEAAVASVAVDEPGREVYIGGYFDNDTSYLSVDFDPGPDSLKLNANVIAAFLHKLNQGFCSGFFVNIDSVEALSCTDSGVAFAAASGGPSPYTYEWNTVSVDNDSVLVTGVPGIFTVTASDSNLCTAIKTVIINGPDISTGGFDLNANMLADPFRFGFDSYIWLDGLNDGCDPVSGAMSIVLDPLIIYNSAVPAPDVISGDTLRWIFTSLTYDSLHITPQIDVTTSTSAAIGDSVCFIVLITPVSSDADTTNNRKHYCFPVLNGYDPNDKQGYPQGECEDRIVDVGQKMTYTVRFQNTGNAEAINIYILDSLDSDLDLNSVRVIGNSHNLLTEILPGNVLKFRFDNIHLPDSTSDEANSHGHVIYEVDQQAGLPSGTLLENTAYIYFDFNPAIVTNTVINQVGTTGLPCDIVTGDQEDKIQGGIKIYPNPANESITISTNGTTAQNIKLMDLSGRIIDSTNPTGHNTIMNLSSLQNGIYFIQVKMLEEVTTVKVVKQ